MKVLLALLVVCLNGFALAEKRAVTTPTVCEEKLKTLTQKVDILLRQLQLQQMFIEERTRSDGGSGLKQARWSNIGTRPYHASSHSMSWVAGGIYPHTQARDYFATSGTSAVINGVEFRMAAQGLMMYRPGQTFKSPRRRLPLPAVPPQVLAKKTVPEQVAEMKEWFKAWRDQNYQVRDYRKYFKPVLCYLEGKWLKSQGDDKLPFTQSFLSNEERARYQAYSGAIPLERHAFKPTSIVDFENGKPVFATWDYSVLCHPVNQDIPTSTFRVADDLSMRTARKWTLEHLSRQMFANFQLNPLNRPWKENSEFADSDYEFLDQLMSQVPGPNNYDGKLYDDSFSKPTHPFTAIDNKAAKLNTAFYHRWSKVSQTGTGSLKARHRGFSDNTVFMAQTSQPSVAGMKVEDCNFVGGKKVCKSYEQRWSYAIPLFVTYLNPLANWNPYGLTIHMNRYNDRTVYANGRTGGFTNSTAYNGISEYFYFSTPGEFFGNPKYGDAKPKGVLDPKGVIRSVSRGGIKMIIPNIPGVGALRQTYPIFPIHGEGSTAWKESEALADLVLRRKTHANMMVEPSQI
ncbi:uncharacterized protein LOC106164888 isoform X1 [Lingula anatina]|uniref:Uncharacterized protein LOC106164888 isoform X1 n=2 Tax=Lingula anatina TaxID=7574 RepID=A0A1S3IJJ1_LINAN|nr:uncharacterized protein LOC106164888 isoform X1 [Lingula anatina]|eukprot:XP_013398382.1 uncharacterized protein LOC106164888 isoform X1 [Lingula anatina]